MLTIYTVSTTQTNMEKIQMAYNKLSTYKTAWTEDANGVGSVIYTNTIIVSWDNDTITLRSGGWETVTTKRKMNQASHQFGLGFGVYQRDHVWLVDMPNGDTVLFKDGMTFSRNTKSEAA